LHVGINFCVWTLQKDGLTVPPFEKHPSGDGFLRAVGLDAELWRFWVREAVIGQRTPANAGLAEIGTPLLQKRLQELWQIYLPGASDWRKSYRRKDLFGFSSPEERLHFRNDLLPFQRNLPELRIYFVQYPAVVSFVVPPVSVVLGINETSLPGKDVSEHILRAVETLST
jgi:hypothetical protein